MDDEIMTQDPGFLKQAMASGPGLVAVIRESDFKIVFLNDLFEYYLGYTPADIAETDIYFTDLLEEYQYDRLKFQLASVISNIAKRTTYTIYKLSSKQGVVSSYYLFASPVERNAEKEELLFHLLVMPDHSKWSMPFTSYDTRELFLEQFQSEDFGTFEWIIDVDKAFWSPGVYKIYEVEEHFNEVNHFFARSFVHPNDKERVAVATKDAIANDTVVDIEFKIVTAKNNIKTIHSLARITKGNDGKPIKFVGSIRDVTGRRNIEEDLRRKVEELHLSNKELEEFAYVASHDMQEPLRKITTFSSRLMEKYKDALSGEGAMYLTRMTASAENMRILINDLLEFSRIANTQQPFMQVDLNVVLRQVKTDLELIIEETGTQIQSIELPVLDAIPSQMKQLFANIISNAIKFRKQGIAPVINIDAGQLDAARKLLYDLPKNEHYYTIKISDNGIGFEAEYAARIFNVFQRLHGKSEYPGSGIGLAICKKILEYHSGIIYAESTPGKGATFVFILPKNRRND